MKKGFTLIELLVVVAIIGILSSVVVASFHSAKKKGEEDKLAQQHISKEDKFSRSSIDENISYNPDAPCAGIPDLSLRKECEDGTYKARMIQDCISRYSD